MSGRKLSFLAASIAITLVATTVGISAASSAPTDPSVEAQMGAPITDAARCPGTPIANYAIGADPYGLFGIAEEIGADAYYRDGWFGQGVDVALIDSGVTEVPGMDKGNLVQGPDLSFESQAAYEDDPNDANPDLAYRDTYGHGTHMAGIIAGRDKPTPTNWKQFVWEDPTAFRGIAPGSRVVSVKVADALGAVDVTQIIAAIDWVVQNRDKNGLNIRVINLSLGLSEPFGAYKTNALAYAAEQAWNAGIVVVAAAGNGGRNAIAKEAKLPAPAFDPNILAIGSYDTKGTVGKGQHEDDTSSDFTQKGSNERNVDVTAPGDHVMSLHVPGSHADTEIEADCRAGVASTGSWTSPMAGPDARFVRGSGTSQSAAVVSGAIALMLSKPSQAKLTPTEVRKKLRLDARPLCWAHEKSADGRGELNLSNDNDCFKADSKKNKSSQDSVKGDKLKTYAPSTGSFQISHARPRDPLPCTTARSVVANKQGPVIRGVSPLTREPGVCQDMYERARGGAALDRAVNVDIHGHYVDAKMLAQRERDRTAWTVDPDGGWRWMDGPVWFGAPITVNGRMQWPTKQWNTDWTGTRWSGTRWSGTRWSGTRWSGTRWSESTWSGTRWSGTRWSGTRWSDAIFRDHAWR
jgi:serine protease AprX